MKTTETVELTLYNESSTDLEFNPYQWSIQTKTADGWEAVEKRTSGNGRLVLSPGDTQTWTFREVVDFINDQAPTDAGVYTAAINVPDPGGSDWIQCLALFRII